MRKLMQLFATGADQPSITDRATVDSLYRHHRMRILIAITLGYGLAYTCRLALSVVKKPLLDEGIFTPIELGMIGAALFYAYAFGKLVNGLRSSRPSATTASPRPPTPCRGRRTAGRTRCART